MTIAINTRFLFSDQLEGYGYFIAETFKRITRNHPEHRFVFIFDRPYDKKFLFEPNIEAVSIGPPARHPLLWKFWYDIRIPAILKKYKADVFVSPDGYCSLNTRVPQCMVLHDLAFLHYPSFISASHLRFWKRNMGKYLQKASSIATVSEFSKTDILTHYKVEKDKIDIVYSAVKEIFQPIAPTDKKEVKAQYTDGKEYFIYAGAIHPRKNLLSLLRAFSVFKKRQQSGMKLVLTGRLAWKYKEFLKDLSTYRYREDVIMTGYVEEKEMTRLIGSSYALIYPSLHEGFGVPVLEAMQCAIPVITSLHSSMQEIGGDAALYAKANDFNDIAENMMRLYKDEELRNELIMKGRERAKLFSWDKTAELLWQSILKAFP